MKLRSKILAVAVVALVAAVAAGSIARAASLPRVIAQVGASSVTRGHSFSVAIGSTACVRNVTVIFTGPDAGNRLATNTAKDPGTGFSLRVSVPRAAKAGRYEVSSVFGQPCSGSYRGPVSLAPVLGYFSGAVAVR